MIPESNNVAFALFNDKDVFDLDKPLLIPGAEYLWYAGQPGAIKVMFIVAIPEGDASLEGVREMLHKMSQFLGADQQSYVIINVHGNQFRWTDIYSQYMPNNVIVFGNLFSNLCLQANPGEYCYFDFYHSRWVYAEPASQLYNNDAKKKMLGRLFREAFQNNPS